MLFSDVDHVLRAPPTVVVVASGISGLASGCVGDGRQFAASRKLSNLGMARFIGDVVGDVKFTALSTPSDDKRQHTERRE